MTPLDLATGADLDALGAAVNVPRAGTVVVGNRSGMTIAGVVGALALAWRLDYGRRLRGRRSRQVRGQRARCAARVAAREAASPRPHTVGAVQTTERRRDLTLYGEHVRLVGAA